MKKAWLLACAPLVLGLLAIPAGSAQAMPVDGCGWQGNVNPLIAKADIQIYKPSVTAKVQDYFGDNADITAYKRMEVDLYGLSPESTSPTDPTTLVDNRVTYNITVMVGQRQTIASVQLRYYGLCWKQIVFKPMPWLGSTGTDRPLKVNARKALKLAQAYRKANPDAFPLDQPLASMNLMQSTTRPPDFGKLRWYVNYDNGMGGFNILAVYMNGTVSAIG